MHFRIKIQGSQTDCLCVYSLIAERLADGILGVKHGVATFFIQFLECYYNAATCCYLVDRVLVVRDSTALRIWQLRISGSSFRQIYIYYYLV